MSAKIQHITIAKSAGIQTVDSPPSKPVGGYLHGNNIRLVFQSTGEPLSTARYAVVQNEGEVLLEANEVSRYICSLYQGVIGYHVFVVQEKSAVS